MQEDFYNVVVPDDEVVATKAENDALKIVVFVKVCQLFGLGVVLVKEDLDVGNFVENLEYFQKFQAEVNRQEEKEVY